MNKEAGVRGLAIAFIRKSGKILVSPGYDKVKDEHFYRLLGGGVEFGETSLEALHREFKEELDVELINTKLVAVLENIFTFEDIPGHEICFLYEADFKDATQYENEEFQILDSKIEGKVIWLDTSDLTDIKIYPDGVKNYI